MALSGWWIEEVVDLTQGVVDTSSSDNDVLCYHPSVEPEAKQKGPNIPQSPVEPEAEQKGPNIPQSPVEPEAEQTMATESDPFLPFTVCYSPVSPCETRTNIAIETRNVQIHARPSCDTYTTSKAKPSAV